MARYLDAIQWIADNDDTEFMLEDADSAPGSTSVTLALVIDLFEVTEQRARADLAKALKRNEGAGS